LTADDSLLTDRAKTFFIWRAKVGVAWRLPSPELVFVGARRRASLQKSSHPTGTWQLNRLHFRFRRIKIQEQITMY
jgi:hypothetical protein